MEVLSDRKHSWDLDPQQGVALQQKLRTQLLIRGTPRPVKRLAGVDVGFEDHGKITRAAVVVMSFPELRPLQHIVNRLPTSFPYVPGLLSFRELPALLPAFARLDYGLDLVLVDGHGFAHPRRFGLACHLGFLLDVATIGVGKTRLVGRYQAVGPDKGDWCKLHDGGRQIGVVLRTREGVRPVFVSPGHRIGFAAAKRFVLATTTRYRLPEPIRAAHKHASQR